MAVVCSWQTAYQICDRYGDAFKAVAGLAAAGSAQVVAPGQQDPDAWMPLTLGRALLPGDQDLVVCPQGFHQAVREAGARNHSDLAAPRRRGLSPPGRRFPSSAPPGASMTLLALASSGSLAPPLA